MARKVKQTQELGDLSSRGLARRLAHAERTGKTPKVADEPADEAPAEESEAEETRDWTAPAEPITEAEVSALRLDAIGLDDISEEDLDRLWDWIRQDGDYGKKFLGVECRTSIAMRERFMEAFPQNAFTVKDADNGHIGFAAASPLNDALANVHLYLAKAVRGSLPLLLPQLVQLAMQAVPGRQLAITTREESDARLYRSLGFELTYLLTLTPKPTDL